MSTCAVMLVKDEADIIEPVVRHLLANVDQVLVADNGSTDGTRELLGELSLELPLIVQDDLDPAYHQSAKTTALAQAAERLGHQWVVPCDADEVWYATDGRRIADFLAGLTPDVSIATAALYNHFPSLLDDATVADPVRRIGWRQRDRGALPKVACRLRPGLTIHAGNHGADYRSTMRQIRPLASAGLVIRHFSWRTPEQYVRKVRNGLAALAAAPDIGVGTCAHWRIYEDASDEHIAAWFSEYFVMDDPYADDSLIYDPAPVAA